jgi:hypothetical protein
MKKVLVTLFIVLAIISTNQESFSQTGWATIHGFMRPDRGSFCMCGAIFELDSIYRQSSEEKYIELTSTFSGYNLNDYKNLHIAVNGWTSLCVEGCPGLEVFSIQVVVQGHIRTDIPSSCMCGTAFELDLQYRAAPENKYIFLIGDLSNYTNVHIEVKGRPSSCAEGCTVVKVDEVKIRPTVSVDDHTTLLPSATIIKQNFPNPFNPTTTIKYEITQNSFVRLCVYDLLGKEVAALVSEEKKPGNYEAVWDASDFPSGIYYYRLNAGKNLLSGRMCLIK